MDYAHLHAQQFTIAINNLLYSKDSVAGSITEGRLREKNGFVLNGLATNFLYTEKQAYLKDLNLRTPGSAFKITTGELSFTGRYPERSVSN